MAQAATVDVIGEDILYNGQLVAVLVASGVSFSTLDDFRWRLMNATLFEDESKEEEPSTADELRDSKTQGFELALESVADNLKPYLRGGLIKQSDLLKLLEQLKQEGFGDLE